MASSSIPRSSGIWISGIFLVFAISILRSISGLSAVSFETSSPIKSFTWLNFSSTCFFIASCTLEITLSSESIVSSCSYSSVSSTLSFSSSIVSASFSWSSWYSSSDPSWYSSTDPSWYSSSDISGISSDIFFVSSSISDASSNSPSGISNSSGSISGSISSISLSNSSSLTASTTLLFCMIGLKSILGSSVVDCDCRYCSSSSSFGVTPASSFGITSLRRSMIFPASCNALAFADSSFCWSASYNAASAALLVFSQSSNTSWIDIWPVIWCSSCVFSFMTIDIWPSESSPSISWKLCLSDPSISSSVAICWVSCRLEFSSSSFGSLRYGISSTIFLMLSIVSATSPFSLASIICCIPLAISFWRFTVLNFSWLTSTCGIVTVSCASSPAFVISAASILVFPSCSNLNLRYFSSWSFVRGWYNILSSSALSTYGPSPNHKISSSHASIHFSVFPALW